MKSPWSPWRTLAALGAVLAVAGPLYLWGFRSSGAFRVELGGADELYRSGAWGRDYEDHGPFRLRRGARRMTYFQARMAFDGARLRIPAVVAGGDAELRLRMHRYGQPGIVRLFAGGVEIQSFVFEEDSYPWDVRRVPVPGEFLRDGVLSVELVREETREKVDLPPRAIAAFDWVELAPASEARLRPTASQWWFALLLPALVVLTLSFARSSTTVAVAGGAATALVVAAAQAAAPGCTSYAMSRIWLAFPLGGVLFVLLVRLFHTERGPARALAAGFTLVLLLSSTILFFPDHLPPDIRPHMRQVQRVAARPWSGTSFWELSSSYGKAGRTLSLGRAHPDSEYVAPYSPWSYFLIHGLRTLLDEPRFLVEYLAVVLAAALVVLVYGLVITFSAFGASKEAASFGAVLAALEISIWHHGSRAHLPALLGEVFFVAAVLYLSARYETIDRPGTALRFSLLSLLATLSYSATLPHFVLFIAWLVLFEALHAKSPWLGKRGRAFLIASVAGTLAGVAIFYRHFLGKSGASEAFHPEGYVAPATFLFLRNQVRDTAVILTYGYPAFVALALPAYAYLRSWVPQAFSRRILLAWTATYVSFLVLKDPLLFPGLLLQIKEDLMAAPLFCALGGLTLSHLAARGRSGKLVTYAILALFLLLRANDFVYNADTIQPP